MSIIPGQPGYFAQESTLTRVVLRKNYQVLTKYLGMEGNVNVLPKLPKFPVEYEMGYPIYPAYPGILPRYRVKYYLRKR